MHWCMTYDHISTPAGSLAKSEMEDLRKAMPSIPHVLVKLHRNPDNSKLSMFVEFCYIDCTKYFNCIHLTHFNIGNQLERLLMLESEFGALPGFTPAVDAVVDFLTTVRFPMQLFS